ncbi:MAG TPA: hypothetical protein P5509_05380 [Bacteroidales bacterium]|nr:hypothetical protein [Bacteroidales bacterium]
MKKRIPTLNEHINEGKEQTLKAMILDFVEGKGKASWKEIHDFILTAKGLPLSKENRGQFASYFSGHSSYLASLSDNKDKKTSMSHGLLMRPTKKDPRYLEKDDKGLYYVTK